MKLFHVFTYLIIQVVPLLACGPMEPTVMDSEESGFAPYRAQKQSGIFGSYYRDKSAPPLIVTSNAPQEPVGKRVRVHLYPEDVVRRISPMMFGNNGAIWMEDKHFNHPEFKEALGPIQFPLLRWPGGSTSDKYHFDGNPPAHVRHITDQDFNGDWALDTIEFLTYTYSKKAEPIIIVNHGRTAYGDTAYDGDLEIAVELAANWVEYCNAPNDGSNPRGGTDWAAKRAADGHPVPFNVRFWEVGNEVFGKWETGHTSGGQYANHFVRYATEMKRVDPNIEIGASVVVNFDIEGSTQWMTDLLSNAEFVRNLSFLDLHDYFTYVRKNQTSLSGADLLVFLQQVQEDKVELDRLIRNLTNREKIPLFFGEYHLTQPRNPLNLVSGSGIFVAAALGEIIRTGFDAAAFWDIINEYKYEGDFGIISRGHPTLPDYTPYPVYYPFYFYSRNFGDTLIGHDQDDWQLKIYPTTFSSGALGLMIVNLTEHPRQLEIDTGVVVDGYVNSWVLESDHLMLPEFRVNGIGLVHDGGGPLLEDDMAYFQDVGQTEQLIVSVPARSLTSMVVY